MCIHKPIFCRYIFSWDYLLFGEGARSFAPGGCDCNRDSGKYGRKEFRLLNSKGKKRLDIYCSKSSSIHRVAFLCLPSSQAARGFQTSLSTLPLPFSLSWRCNPSAFSKYVNGKNDNRLLKHPTMQCSFGQQQSGSSCSAPACSWCRQGKKCPTLRGLSIPRAEHLG